jgi:CHAT domain-containing protein
MAAMKRAGCFCLACLLIGSLLAAPGPADASSLPLLKKDLSEIILDLLSCFERTRDRHFLEMAIYFAGVRTYPIFDLNWGKYRQHAAAEGKLLAAASSYRGLLGQNACLPKGSEQNFCRQASAYVRMVDHEQVPALKVRMKLPDTCKIDQIQSRLSVRQVLLKYVLLEDRALLFFITAQSVGYEFLSVGTPRVAAMIKQLSEPLEDFASGKVDYLRIHFDMELAHRLFNILLKNVVKRFPRSDELLIIPDQVLFKLPFETLVMGFKRSFQQDDMLFSEYLAADYVIQKYAVSYFLSLVDFHRQFEGRKDYPYVLAAFGQPQVANLRPAISLLSGSTISHIAEIPSTRLEILNLEKIFTGSSRRVFLGSDFNKENFTRFAPQAKLIHIATHFFTNGEDPSRSAFLFSSTGDSPPLCDARQILKLRLRAELVILSACETSEKDLQGFKSLSGMTAAFRQSGVRDLIASLWPVDEFSSQIVPLFYEEYLQNNSHAQALRKAKLELLGKTIPFQDNIRLSLGHPFLWANYVLYHFCR